MKTIVLGSINDLDKHPEYALRKVRQVAETILKDDSATDNERALADCIIALERSMMPKWVNVGAI